MKVHAFARAEHLAHHLYPIWRHLGDLRGEFVQDRMGRAPRHWGPNDVVLVASYLDIASTMGRRTVYCEHGAGQRYCLGPDTRVLTSDLRWVPIWQVAVGDRLVSFDEHPIARFRQWREAEVLAADIVPQQCYELEFADGSVVTASEDHLWLRRERDSYGWMTTSSLQDAETYPKHSSKLVKCFDVWEEDTTWGGGYLAAAFDGEGCFTQTRRGRVLADGTTGQSRGSLAFSQRDNDMLKTVLALLDERGFDYWEGSNGGTNQNVHQVAIRGGLREVARLLGSIRPRRLMADLAPFNGGQLRGSPVELIRKTHVGKTATVALGTSTRTFIAEGFASHNSGGNPEAANYYHGADHPGNVIGYISPRQDVADSWGRPAFAAGAPVCDPYELFSDERVAAITFHWYGAPPHKVGVPEAGNAFEHYVDQLPAIVDQLGAYGYEVLAHHHPRFTHMHSVWTKLGMKVATAEEVRTRASLIIGDNTSLLYEMAYCFRDVICLNAPWFRRDVEHGLRFWSHVPGLQINSPDELIDVIPELDSGIAAVDPAICTYVYGKAASDGNDGARAAAWITGLIGAI